MRVAVEVDGGAHEAEERQAYDLRRTRCWSAAGIKVLRVPMQALLGLPDRVVAWIVSRCEAASAIAPPSRGASRSRHLPICDGEENEEG